MACYRPIQGFLAAGGGIAFSPKAGYVDRPMQVPCGQCIGCRLERSRQWAVRCMHEASQHEANCFVTLTYRDNPRSLDRQAFPVFMRALRKRTRLRIKYFHCGEYGELLARPHYHGLIFGYDFPDKLPWRTSPAGHKQWRSALLEQLWPHGFSSIGALTFETAAYTARYCTKKVTGDLAAAHYSGREPEFMSCSKGIGLSWLMKYHAETYKHDHVITRGHEAKPPRYYDKKLAELQPDRLRRVQLERVAQGNTRAQKWNRTPERLAVRETVKRAELGTRSREFENAAEGVRGL